MTLPTSPTSVESPYGRLPSTSLHGARVRRVRCDRYAHLMAENVEQGLALLDKDLANTASPVTQTDRWLPDLERLVLENTIADLRRPSAAPAEND